MKVILKADVKGSGKKGDIIEVSDGFAKNFLLKKGLAETATASGINEATAEKGGGAVPQGRGNQGHAGLGRQAQGPERKRRD